MQTETLAHKLGLATPVSRLRDVAKRFGLVTEKDLIDEAVARGCFHFLQSETPPTSKVSEAAFPNEQLALAMLTIANPYDPWLLRAGTMLLSHPGNDVSHIVLLAREEHSEAVVRDIARAGLRYEPQNEFWKSLMKALPDLEPCAADVLPHHSRFVSIPGKIGPGKMGKPVWLRPLKAVSLGYAA